MVSSQAYRLLPFSIQLSPKIIPKKLAQSPYFHSGLVRDTFGKCSNNYPKFGHFIHTLPSTKIGNQLACIRTFIEP